jgi:regulator of sirC expression with transglutaminase-like and TPR domain
MDQDTAILHLLGDDDPATVRMVKEKLVEVKSLEELRVLHTRARGKAAGHLEGLISEGAQQAADAAFTAVCQHLSDDADLEGATWLLATTFAPDQDYQAQRDLLATWGEELARRLPEAHTPDERVDVAVDYLGRELRLRGNDANYYAIQNSLLPRVIESRRGIPISLSMLYMMVGRRAGLEIEGVGLPGHFLARHGEVFFDPFHGGRRVGMEECAALLQQQNLALTPQHLRPATSRQMLLRMLTNIYYIAEQMNPALAAKISRWAEMLK